MNLCIPLREQLLLRCTNFNKQVDLSLCFSSIANKNSLFMTWHNDVSLVDIDYHILRKTVEGYYNSVDFNTFEKIIFKQSIFCI